MLRTDNPGGNMKKLLIFLLSSNFLKCMQVPREFVAPETIIIHVDARSDERKADSPSDIKPKLKHYINEQIQDNNRRYCCSSSNKLKIAILAALTTTLTAAVSLAVHFTDKCK